MPSASRDPARGGFLIRYRPPNATRQRQVRSRPEWRLRDLDAARALARQFDHASRILDRTDPGGLGSPPAAARLLVRHGLMTEQEASALVQSPLGPLARADESLEGLFLAHATTRREDDGGRYLRHLREFLEWSGAVSARQVSVDLVERYVEMMDERGDAYYTRRHRLVPIKRAMAMAVRLGIPNPLAGQPLDRREPRLPPDAYSLDDLAKLLKHVAGDARTLTAFAAMGCMGLRPSEAARAQVGDVRDGLLVVGERARKNSASYRLLPIPAALLPAVETMTKKRRTDEALIPSRHRAFEGALLDRQSFMRFFKRRAKDAGLRELPPRTLRKTFFTASVRIHRLDRAMVETYMGHKITGIAPVSADHYLAGADPEYLRPVAEKWHEWLQKVLPGDAGP